MESADQKAHSARTTYAALLESSLKRTVVTVLSRVEGDWIALRLRLGLPIPVVAGIDLSRITQPV